MQRTLQSGLVLFFAIGLAPYQALAQTPAPTDGSNTGYLNPELPTWLRFNGEERARVETLDGVGFRPAGNTYLLNRFRLSLAATPRTWLKFFFQSQDSRSYFTNVTPTPTSQRDPWDLRQGYVEIGNREESPVTLRAGRQALDFGEARLVGDPNWSNVGRTFDAVRLTLHYHKLKLDAFSSAADKIYADGFSTPVPGEHFDGLYGSLDKVVPAATIEPYIFWRMEHNVKGELVKAGNMQEETAGIRWVGKLPYGMDYGMESAIERGNQANEPISAWATHLVLGETLPDAQHLPRFFAEFNRATGDQNPKDGIHGAFDPLFPSAHDKYGVTDLFPWTNIVHARAGFQYKLRQNLTLKVADNSFWLANKRDGIYSGSKVAIASNGHEGSHIGQEPDVQAQWNATRHTLLDFAFGHIFAGEFLRNAGRPSGFNSVVVGATERF